jgi:Flp pilus assembly protein TadD
VNILLGLTPLAHGVSENSKSVVAGEFLTLAELLKARGYATGAFISSFALDSRFGLDQGFDVYDDFYSAKPAPGLAYSERSAGETIKAARQWLSRRKEKWFCWIHLWEPHAPYTPPEPYLSRYAKDPYSGEVAAVDAALGKFFAEAEREGWPGKTFIILTGDHGESLGEHGEMTHTYFAYNSTIWVPLIIEGPGIRPSRVKDYVSHVDLFPTVCELLGLEKNPGLQGESLKPLWEGKTRKASPIYFEALDANLNRGWAPLRGLIEAGKKFIDSPIPELYDLEKDFDERTNLSERTDLIPYRKKFAEIEGRLSLKRASQGGGVASRETREKLRSLGYVASSVTPKKKAYGRDDDLKTLLPLEQKLEQASQLEKSGRNAECARLLEEVIQARKDFSTAYDHLYRLSSRLGLVEEGLQVLKRGFEANPENFALVSGYGIALVKAGRLAEGVDVLHKALGLFDQDPEVWNSLGVAFWKRGDLEKALQHFEKALSMDPKDAIYNDNLGSLHVVMSLKTKNAAELEQAVSFFKTSLASDPTLASAYNGLGGAYKIMGKKEEAIANWEKSLELNPEYDFPLYNLAVAYLEKGDPTRALAYGQRYLAVKGNALTAGERKEIESLIEKCKK